MVGTTCRSCGLRRSPRHSDVRAGSNCDSEIQSIDFDFTKCWSPSELTSRALPALASAKESARRIHGLANLRQIGVATIAYAADNEDRIISARHQVGATTFVQNAGDSNFGESVRLLTVSPATNLPVPSTIQTGAIGIQLTWPSGVLQPAAHVAGLGSDVGDATSPFAVTPNEARGFYQIKLQ